jgi:hypothetical protein
VLAAAGEGHRQQLLVGLKIRWFVVALKRRQVNLGLKRVDLDALNYSQRTWIHKHNQESPRIQRLSRLRYVLREAHGCRT